MLYWSRSSCFLALNNKSLGDFLFFLFFTLHNMKLTLQPNLPSHSHNCIWKLSHRIMCYICRCNLCLTPPCLNIMLHCILFMRIRFFLFFSIEAIFFLLFPHSVWLPGEFRSFQVKDGFLYFFSYFFSFPDHQDSVVMGSAPEEAMDEKNRNKACQIVEEKRCWYGWVHLGFD